MQRDADAKKEKVVDPVAEALARAEASTPKQHETPPPGPYTVRDEWRKASGIKNNEVIEGHYRVALIIGSGAPKNENLWSADWAASPYSFRVTPQLPGGLRLDDGDGVIMGVPQSPSDETYVITAENEHGQVDTTLRIRVTDVAPSSIAYPEVVSNPS